MPSTRSITMSALAALMGVSGCVVHHAGAPSTEPGTTTLRIVNHVAAPGELDRVTLAVDGEALALSAIPPEGGEPANVALLHLKPGAHLLSVRAKARASGSDAGFVVVGAQRPFHVADGPACITVDVVALTSQKAAPDDAPIAIALTMQGGRMMPDLDAAPSEDKDERCEALLPIPKALCRAAVDLDEATRRNDVALAYCVRDKLAEMRQLALIGEMAEARVARLSKQVELCAGDGVAPDGVTVTRRPR